MLPMKENYIIDKKGKPVSVILPKKDYEKLLEYIEELEDIAAYDRAKKEKGSPKPWASVKR
jgi:PHD/YefM family antitoxin component YafN of YafNO toxin-antitoxin module